MAKIGERVAAVSSASGNTVRLFGFGVYVGDHQLPQGTEGYGADALSGAGIPNPTIKLDNGDYIFGCQCWWGSEAGFNQRYAGYTIEVVPVPEGNKGYQPPASQGYTPPEGIVTESL